MTAVATNWALFEADLTCLMQSSMPEYCVFSNPPACASNSSHPICNIMKDLNLDSPDEDSLLLPFLSPSVFLEDDPAVAETHFAQTIETTRTNQEEMNSTYFQLRHGLDLVRDCLGRIFLSLLRESTSREPTLKFLTHFLTQLCQTRRDNIYFWNEPNERITSAVIKGTHELPIQSKSLLNCKSAKSTSVLSLSSVGNQT